MAHPRSRGENDPEGLHAFAQGGSSPLTRGKRSVVSEDVGHDGLIPAHAGKTSRSKMLVSRVWAHPRSRGENMAVAGLAAAGGGSSPLTRGKRGLFPRRTARPRLIPAHAGKTRAHAPHGRRREAHPRSRGENTRWQANPSWNSGSSPLTRGKPGLCRKDEMHVRLIPAHAGKTRPASRPWP